MSPDVSPRNYNTIPTRKMRPSVRQCYVMTETNGLLNWIQVLLHKKPCLVLDRDQKLIAEEVTGPRTNLQWLLS